MQLLTWLLAQIEEDSQTNPNEEIAKLIERVRLIRPQVSAHIILVGAIAEEEMSASHDLLVAVAQVVHSHKSMDRFYDEASFLAYSDKLQQHVANNAATLFKDNVRLFHAGFPAAYSNDAEPNEEDLEFIMEELRAQASNINQLMGNAKQIQLVNDKTLVEFKEALQNLRDTVRQFNSYFSPHSFQTTRLQIKPTHVPEAAGRLGQAVREPSLIQLDKTLQDMQEVSKIICNFSGALTPSNKNRDITHEQNA